MGLCIWHEDWLIYKQIVYGNSDFCSWSLHSVDVLRCFSPEAIDTGTWADSAGKSGTFGEFSWEKEVSIGETNSFTSPALLESNFVQHSKILAL